MAAEGKYPYEVSGHSQLQFTVQLDASVMSIPLWKYTVVSSKNMLPQIFSFYKYY